MDLGEAYVFLFEKYFTFDTSECIVSTQRIDTYICYFLSLFSQCER